ncbi:type III secretion system chaperone [Aeromonas jandaei]|uniref:Type III secretion system chaperone n=1 Tax=Aeromonas jandaei TaxID=650 RepID=A0ABD7EQX5_AERJA|nr:type III secretion system chaperone [Aeromonas jandaei]QWL63595.1 type III secretion system chaperone [Aeromonas jandaei]
MDLDTLLTRLARQLDADQLNQLSADEWLLLATDGLALQITRTDTGLVLACRPDDRELDPRWMPLLLSYNGLLTTTGGMVMGLTGNQHLLMQLPVAIADADALASVTLNFLQLVREWQLRLLAPCQPTLSESGSLNMLSAIKG